MKKRIETFTFIIEKDEKSKNFLKKIKYDELLENIYAKNDNELNDIKILYHNFELQNKHTYLKTNLESSLIEGYIQAYQNNYPITINPDIIWLLIIQGLSRYINLNRKIIHNRFVNHEKLNKITIQKKNFFPRNKKEENWKDIIKQINDSIYSFLPDSYLKNLLPDFSTKDQISKMACNAFLLYENKTLNDFNNFKTDGSIPKITLEGTVDDWKKIDQKINLLNNLNLNWWTKELKIIIENIIKTKNTNLNIDLEFWKSMIILNQNDINENNSDDILPGWLFKFFPDFKTKKFIESFNELKIPSSNVSIPFNLLILNNSQGLNYNCNLEFSIFWEIIINNNPIITPKIKYIVITEIDKLKNSIFSPFKRNTYNIYKKNSEDFNSYNPNDINKIKYKPIKNFRKNCDIKKYKTERMKNYRDKKRSNSLNMMKNPKKKNLELENIISDNNLSNNSKKNIKDYKSNTIDENSEKHYISNYYMFSSNNKEKNITNKINNGFVKERSYSNGEKNKTNPLCFFGNIYKKLNYVNKKKSKYKNQINYLNEMNDRMKQAIYSNPMIVQK